MHTPEDTLQDVACACRSAWRSDTYMHSGALVFVLIITIDDGLIAMQVHIHRSHNIIVQSSAPPPQAPHQLHPAHGSRIPRSNIDGIVLEVPESRLRASMHTLI